MALILSLPCPFIVTAQGLSTKNLGSCPPHPTTLPHLRSWYLSSLSLGEVTQLKWLRVTHLAPACLGISCWSHFEDSFLWWRRQSQARGWEVLPSLSFLSVLPPFLSTEPKPAFLFVLSPNVVAKALFVVSVVLSFCLPDRLLLLSYLSLVMVPSSLLSFIRRKK